MTPRLSNAIVASTLWHGAAVAAILGLTWLAGLRSGKPLDLFELVAGEGDNYLATEAPALGTAGGVEPDPATAPAAAPEPAMVMTTKAAPPPPVVKDVDFSKSVQKVATTAARKIAAKTAAEQKAAEKAAKEEAAKQAKQAKMTLEEFNRLNPGKTPPAGTPKSADVRKIDAKGIAAGVVGGSTKNTTGGAGGKAMTATAGSVAERYTSMLMSRLETSLRDQSPPGLSDSLVAVAAMRVLVDGRLAGGRITRTSGNAEFDKAVLDAIRITTLPERPGGFRTDEFTVDFKSKTAGDE